MHQQAIAIQSTSARKTGAGALLIIALVAAAGFLAMFAFPYFSLSQARFGPYWPKRGWLLLHIGGGMIALVWAASASLLHRPVEARRIAVDITAWYWHFMAVLWIYIFLLLGLAR